MGLLPLDEQEIRYQVCQVKDLPPMPLAVQRLFEIIKNELASVKDLERFIGYDQVLSARVLRMANSAYYGFRGKVNTLPRAMVVIGFEQAKYISLCSLLMEIFPSGAKLEQFEREKLWKHAFTTARIAAEMALKRPWVSKEEAYILGLLHDLGRVIMAVHFGDHYKSILNLAKQRKVSIWYAESDYGLKHTLIGKWAVVKWAFPEVFQSVIEFHHTPEKSPSFKCEVKLIGLANILANSREHPELLSDECTLSCCRDLFVTEEEWEGYQECLKRVKMEVDQFWDLLK